MTYKASEIIERAKNLADIGNTDYISHKEASQYLNDAYAYVYQLAINRADNFFVKAVDIATGDYQLPDDFYQLRAIKNVSSGKLYTRKALNAGINEPGYEIINNRLKLSGVNNRCELSYYPVPKILSFPDQSKTLSEFPLSQSMSYWDSKLVYDEDGTLRVYDVNTGGITPLEIPSTKTIVGNNYFVAISEAQSDSDTDSSGDTDDTSHVLEYTYYDFDGREIRTVKSETPLVVFRTQGGLIQLLDSYTISYKGSKTVVLETDYVQAGNEALYYVSDDILYKHEFGEDEPEEIDGYIDSFHVSEKFSRDYLVFEKRGGLFAYRPDWDVVPLDVDFNAVIGYTANYVITTDGVAVIAYSNEPDTLLNYPNNAYYTILSYQLATYFIAKQGGDVSILQAQLEKAKMDFEDNAQDAFTYPRIKNVY